MSIEDQLRREYQGGGFSQEAVRGQMKALNRARRKFRRTGNYTAEADTIGTMDKLSGQTGVSSSNISRRGFGSVTGGNSMFGQNTNFNSRGGSGVSGGFRQYSADTRRSVAVRRNVLEKEAEERSRRQGSQQGGAPNFYKKDGSPAVSSNPSTSPQTSPTSQTQRSGGSGSNTSQPTPPPSASQSYYQNDSSVGFDFGKSPSGLRSGNFMNNPYAVKAALRAGDRASEDASRAKLGLAPIDRSVAPTSPEIETSLNRDFSPKAFQDRADESMRIVAAARAGRDWGYGKDADPEKSAAVLAAREKTLREAKPIDWVAQNKKFDEENEAMSKGAQAQVIAEKEQLRAKEKPTLSFQDVAHPSFSLTPTMGIPKEIPEAIDKFGRAVKPIKDAAKDQVNEYFKNIGRGLDFLVDPLDKLVNPKDEPKTKRKKKKKVR